MRAIVAVVLLFVITGCKESEDIKPYPESSYIKYEADGEGDEKEQKP